MDTGAVKGYAIKPKNRYCKMGSSTGLVPVGLFFWAYFCKKEGKGVHHFAGRPKLFIAEIIATAFLTAVFEILYGEYKDKRKKGR